MSNAEATAAKLKRLQAEKQASTSARGTGKAGGQERAKGRMPATKMNKTEARYAEILEAERHEGAIKAWEFEAINLRIAANTFYRPDFLVLGEDWAVEFHEVKGGFTREDAWVKFKTVAALYPYFRFVFAQWKGGQWNIKSI